MAARLSERILGKDILNRKAHSSDFKGETQSDDLRLDDDLILVHRVAAGDQNAFAVLYERFSPSIYTYLVHIIWDEAVAEDLIQEVFLALWIGANRIRGQSLVKTWLFQVAHHKAVSWLRRNASKQSLPLFDKPSLDGTPEDRLVTVLRRDQVRAAVSQLSVEHRSVVELAFYHEMHYAEIGQVLRCPVGTVKSRMSYARKYLIGALKIKDLE